MAPSCSCCALRRLTKHRRSIPIPSLHSPFIPPSHNPCRTQRAPSNIGAIEVVGDLNFFPLEADSKADAFAT
jgi:hypothetical protein